MKPEKMPPERSCNFADEAAIRALGVELDDAWNSRDADTLAGLFCHDGDFRNAAGVMLRGRGQIRRHYAEEVFPALPEGLLHETIPAHIRFVAPDVAVGDGEVRLFEEDSKAAEYPPLLVTSVLLREEDRWLISAVRLARPESTG